MSCIVYQTDKRTGVKYAYESISYWDKEKGQPRSKRKYIGKVDPETGEIIPTKKRGAHVEHSDSAPQTDSNLSKLYDEIQKKDKVISELRNEIRECERRCQKMAEILRQISVTAEEAADV